jgi:YVTN family beta-propeller protein
MSVRFVLVISVGLVAGGFTTLAAGSVRASAPTGPMAYVTGSGVDAITPIDTATKTAGTSFSIGAAAAALGIAPNGNSAFVTLTYVARVWHLDLATDKSSARIAVKGVQSSIATTPNGKTVFTVHYDSNLVTAIDSATDTVQATIRLPRYCDAQGIAINPSGTTAYVACNILGKVFPIDITTDALGQPILVGGAPTHLAVTPNGKTIFVVDSGTDEVISIDTATGKLGYVQVGQDPEGVAISPDGRTAYVANDFSDTVTPIDTTTLTAGTPIAVPHHPYEIAITPDGTTAYVTQIGMHEVTPITLATGTAMTPIPVTYGSTIAIAPDQAPVATFNATAAPHGQSTAFDASASTVEFGTITKYVWHFGDGTTITTTAPTTTHTYATAGSYTASLTETDSAGTSTKIVFTGQTVSRNGGPGAHTSKTFTIP